MWIVVQALCENQADEIVLACHLHRYSCRSLLEAADIAVEQVLGLGDSALLKPFVAPVSSSEPDCSFHLIMRTPIAVDIVPTLNLGVLPPWEWRHDCPRALSASSRRRLHKIWKSRWNKHVHGSRASRVYTRQKLKGIQCWVANCRTAGRNLSSAQDAGSK